MMSLAASAPDGDVRRRAELRGAWTGLDQASVMGVELIAAILTWAAIGWLVDRWLGTGPWFLAIGALVGNAAGIYLIWLRSGRMDQRARDDRGTTPAAELDRGVDPVGGSRAG